MKYGTLAFATTNYIKYAENTNTPEQFVNNAMADRKGVGHVSAQMINKGVADQLQEAAYIADGRRNVPTEAFKPLPVLSEQERGERRALSDELHRKYYERIGAIQYSGFPEDKNNFRYTHDLMMKIGPVSEVRDYNAELYENMSYPGGAMKEVIKYHYDMLKKLEPDQLNADELVTKDFTDKDIVDNFERINYCSQLIGQFQNIREYFEKHNIRPTDEEDRQRFAECESLMNKYAPHALAVNELTVRMGIIDNPYYEIVDTNSREYNTMSKLLFNYGNSGKVLSREDDPIKGNRTEFEEFIYMGAEDGMFGVTADLEAAEKHFDSIGVKKEDLEYRIIKDGKVLGTKPFNRDTAGFDLGDNFHSRIEIVNKNDPANKVAIFSDSRGDFARSELRSTMVAPKAPKEPGFFMKLMHKLSNKNYKKEFDAYYKEKSAYDAYNAQKNYKANASKTEDAKAARQRMRDKQNEKVMEKISALPHKTRSDLEFHNAINGMLNAEETKENETIRNYLINASSETFSLLHNGYTSNKIDLKASIENLANGKAEPAPKSADAAAKSEEKAAGNEEKEMEDPQLG